MKVRIKTKISLVVGFFFLSLVAITALSMWSLYRLRHDAGDILKDNYLSLTHVESMRQVLDALPAEPLARDSLLTVFETALNDQKANITEPGEGEATAELRRQFLAFRQSPTPALAAELRGSLTVINTLNLQAITRKDSVAAATAEEANAWLSIFGTLLLLVSFTLILNFPSYIANPIAQLTASIRQIAGKNYRERLPFRSNDEFGEVADAFNEMAARLDEYEHSNLAQLMFEKQRIEALIANLHDAVIGFDENNRILFANPVACALLGLPEKALLGQYAPDLALHNDLLRSILPEHPAAQPLKIFADDKESYFTRESIPVTVVHQQQRREAGRVLLLKNVTPFKELDLAKTHFIATISHELKTPIAGIKMSLKLLVDPRIGPLNAEQQKLAGQIRADSDRLLRITGELLDLAQVETGNLHLSRQPTAPAGLVEYAAQAVEAAFADRQLRLDAQLAPGLPELSLDAEKTAWVLVNLLSNAARHSPEGSTVAVRVERQGAEVVFTVRDSGKGIEPKYQARLFEKFFQAPTGSGGSGKTGTGLGLAIAKDFIEAQGGRIWVESRPGEGALFGFALPATG